MSWSHFSDRRRAASEHTESDPLVARRSQGVDKKHLDSDLTADDTTKSGGNSAGMVSPMHNSPNWKPIQNDASKDVCRKLLH